MYFLGVDGGGTKTEFLIIDENGKMLARNLHPTSHYKQTSFDNFQHVIESGVNEVCSQLNISISDLTYSFIGIPGYGEMVADVSKLEEIVLNILGSSNFKCGNDSEVAWTGSLACQPGINLVAGTGSIGFGHDKNNNMDRVGGWGDLIGDEGSAHWLSLKMLEIFTKQADGRLDKTALYNIVRDSLNLKEDFEILDLVLNKYERKRDKIASLAYLVYEAAKVGDSYAINLYKLAAKENFLTVKALVEKLNFRENEEILVSYSGGVFKSQDFVLKPLKSLLTAYNKDIKLIAPILTPVAGAALYALILSGNETSQVVANLQQQELNI